MESDARGIEEPVAGPVCPGCGAALVWGGPGRRPVYCGRGCSSRAYRQRLDRSRQVALASAADTSHVEIPDRLSAPETELLRMAGAFSAAAGRFVQGLENARAGGEDRNATVALETFEQLVPAFVERLLDQARRARGQMINERVEADWAARVAAAGTAAGTLTTTRDEMNPGAPRGTGNLTTTRDETSRGAGTLTTTREETPGTLTATRDETRTRLPQPMPTPAPALTLGQATGWTPPTERALDHPDRSYDLGDNLVHLTWPQHPGVQALEHDGHLAGWIELSAADDGDPDAWATLINGRLVADATDHQPLLSAHPTDAITLLRLAIGQQLRAR